MDISLKDDVTVIRSSVFPSRRTMLIEVYKTETLLALFFCILSWKEKSTLNYDRKIYSYDVWRSNSNFSLYSLDLCIGMQFKKKSPKQYLFIAKWCKNVYNIYFNPYFTGLQLNLWLIGLKKKSSSCNYPTIPALAYATWPRASLLPRWGQLSARDQDSPGEKG